MRARIALGVFGSLAAVAASVLLRALLAAPDYGRAPRLASVIDDPTRAYGWQTQKATTEVAGLVGCAQAERPLKEIRAKIEKMSLTTEQRSNFVRSVEDALQRIEAADRRKPRWW